MTKKLLGALGLLCLTASAVSAQAPAQMPMQGYVTQTDGTPLDGTETMVFGIYATETGGTALFEETQSVLVEAGYFTAYVGDVGALDLAVFRDNTTLYMSVTVGTEELLPRSQFGTVPYAGYAQYSGDAASVGGMTASDLGSPAFSSLTGIPSGLSDGDDDTTYSAGGGLTLSGTTFSVNTASVQSRVSGTCPVGQAIRVVAAGGGVTCQATGTAYAAGTGLTLSGTTFAANATYLQRRVTGTCPAGQAIRAVGATGTVTCQVVGDITGVTAGAGLSGGGTSGAVSLSIGANAVTAAMHTYGAPMRMPLFPNAQTTSCSGSAIGGANFGTTGTTAMHVANLYYNESTSGSTGLKTNYTRARLQVQCRGTGVIDLLNGCSGTPVATITCGGGTRPWTATSAEFDPGASASWNLRVRATSGTVQWANPAVMLY